MPRRSTVKGSGVLHGRCAAAGSPQLSSILVYARQEMTHFGNQTAFTMQVCARQSRAQFALLSRFRATSRTKDSLNLLECGSIAHAEMMLQSGKRRMVNVAHFFEIKRNIRQANERVQP